MSTSLGIDLGAQQLARKLAEGLPATVVSVALWDRPGSALTVRAVGTPRPIEAACPLWARVSLASMPSFRVALELEEPVFLDLEAPARQPAREEVSRALAPNLRAVYLVPFQIHGEPVGVVGVGEMRSAVREPFTADKRERCRMLVEEFVASSTDAWEADRLRRQVRALGSLLHMVPGLLQARSSEDVLALVTAEVSGWLGLPVRGVLLRFTTGGEPEIAAQVGFDDLLTPTVASQLLLALARAVDATRPVGVVVVTEDPLDPVRTAIPAGGTWTRVSLPLLGAEGLEGVICLYVEEALHLSEWEIDAFGQRAELAAGGLALVRVLSEYVAEAEWFGRTAYESLTVGQRAALEEALTGIHRRGMTLLPDDTARLVDEASGGDGPRLPTPSGVSEALAREVAGLIAGLREARRGERWRDVELNALVRRVAAMVRRGFEVKSLQLSLELAGEPLVTQALPDLVVALVHAIENALEATADGGQVHVRTARDDGHAVIAVEDTGPGLVGLEADAFAPFVSTKGEPHLGLGLAVVRSVASQHGGTAVLLQRAQGGASLQIRLPLGGPGADPQDRGGLSG